MRDTGCPEELNDILHCSIDNRSKACQVILCNYAKQDSINEAIYNRNFPCRNMDITPDYRSEYKVCGDKYRDLNLKRETSKKGISNLECSDKQKRFNPGKPDPTEKDIDLESNLYSLGRLSTKCPTKKYQATLCNTTYVNHPDFLENPVCDNNKIYRFDDRVSHYNQFESRVSDESFLRPKTCFQKDKNLQFNTIPENYKSCVFQPFNNTQELRDYRHPILMQQTTMPMANETLSVGPIRLNHSVERLWENSTKYKTVSHGRPY